MDQHDCHAFSIAQQALGLALWSFGMVIARSCSLTAVADVLAPPLGQSYNTLCERLRDTYREAGAKAGEQRAELNVIDCWAPWLSWLLEGWSSQQMAIAMQGHRAISPLTGIGINSLISSCTALTLRL